MPLSNLATHSHTMSPGTLANNTGLKLISQGFPAILGKIPPDQLAWKLGIMLPQWQYKAFIAHLTLKTLCWIFFFLCSFLDFFSDCIYLLYAFLKESASAKFISYVFPFHIRLHRNFSYFHILKYYSILSLYQYLIYRLHILFLPFLTDWYLSMNPSLTNH